MNATVAIVAGPRTITRLGYEHFHDNRTVDRGIPSFARAPAVTGLGTFYGDPSATYASAAVDDASAFIEHRTPSGITVRHRTLLASYDKIYQDVLSGAVDATGAQVALSSYNNATDRHNLFNQTDVTGTAQTGAVRHTLLVGTELGRQGTGNFRETGYFGDGTATTLRTALLHPMTQTGVVFRQSATDADDRATLGVAAAYARLDRTNTAAPDPTHPALTVQTGAQRTTGYELGASGDVTGAWQVAGAWPRSARCSRAGCG